MECYVTVEAALTHWGLCDGRAVLDILRDRLDHPMFAVTSFALGPTEQGLFGNRTRFIFTLAILGMHGDETMREVDFFVRVYLTSRLLEVLAVDPAEPSPHSPQPPPASPADTPPAAPRVSSGVPVPLLSVRPSSVRREGRP